MYYPTNQPWQGPPPHGTTTSVTTDASTPVTIPWDPQHPRYTGIWDRAGHPGGKYWWLQPDDTDGEQYHRSGLLNDMKTEK